MMKEDYVELFTGVGNPLAPPYESIYVNPDSQLPGKHKPEVREFYKSYGWESKYNGKIPEDHLGVELLFLTLMVEKLLEMDDEFCNTEMRNEIRRFIKQHLISWIPDWNKNVQRNAITLSYKGIGTLILACVEDLYIIMSQSNTNLN